MKKIPLNKVFLFFLFLVFTVSAVLAAPSSTISNYSQKELPFKPSTIEKGFYNKLRDYASVRKYKISLDPHLSIAAIIYSQEVARSGYSMTSALLKYSLFQGGSPEANVFPYLLKFSNEKQFSKFLPEIFKTFAQQKAAHCGIGFSYNPKEKNYVLVILGAHKKVALKPFPKTLNNTKAINLQGRLLEDLKELKVVITTPKNRIITIAPDVDGRDFFATIDFAQGQGKYQIELVGTGKLGPEVLALFPVYVSILPPDRPRKDNIKDPQIYRSSFQAEKVMLEHINKSRKAADLNIIKMSPQVSDIARQHSQEMSDQKYFAHISPLSGKDFSKRLEENPEIAATLTGENIALNETVAGAHHDLMSSPAHRANILNPDFTDIGLGIALKIDRKGDILYYVTEGFFSQIKDLELNNFQKIIFNKINEKRKNLGLPTFILNNKLSNIAKEHSLDMSAHDELAFEIKSIHLFQKVQKAGIKFKYLSMNIFAFNNLNYEKYVNSPEIEQKQFTEVGIGLVQKNSKKFGRKAIWLTLIFAENVH